MCGGVVQRVRPLAAPRHSTPHTAAWPFCPAWTLPLPIHTFTPPGSCPCPHTPSPRLDAAFVRRNRDFRHIVENEELKHIHVIKVRALSLPHPTHNTYLAHAPHMYTRHQGPSPLITTQPHCTLTHDIIHMLHTPHSFPSLKVRTFSISIGTSSHPSHPMSTKYLSHVVYNPSHIKPSSYPHLTLVQPLSNPRLTLI